MKNALVLSALLLGAGAQASVLSAGPRGNSNLPQPPVVASPAPPPAPVPSPGPAPGPNPIPQPIGGGSVMHFSQLLPIFQDGAEPTQASLNGTWQLIAQATTIDCGYFYPDELNGNGIVNPDGSLNQLVFGDYNTPALPGSPAGVVFGVAMYNLGYGNDNQGPYEVAATEPQFAQWGYASSSNVPSNQIYLDWSCRTVTGNSSQIICAQKLNLVNPQMWNAQTQACAADTYGTIQAYERETAPAP